MAFLKAEYKVLAIFVFCVAILLGISANPDTSHWLISVSFIVGAFCSGLAGFIGMRVATKANVRTTNAARTETWPRIKYCIRRWIRYGSRRSWFRCSRS
ncbi:MAG: sodium/proton-translocating pyrophosphatase [Balneolaceae bacterium]|nr:sodium/proton-translocating pyrophosphatase [Balneolaceae bacterium]